MFSSNIKNRPQHPSDFIAAPWGALVTVWRPGPRSLSLNEHSPCCKPPREVGSSTIVLVTEDKTDTRQGEGTCPRSPGRAETHSGQVGPEPMLLTSPLQRRPRTWVQVQAPLLTSCASFYGFSVSLVLYLLFVHLGELFCKQTFFLMTDKGYIGEIEL